MARVTVTSGGSSSGLRFRGAFNAATEYAFNDVVTYERAMWVRNATGPAAAWNANLWTAMLPQQQAAQGATGPQGPPGARMPWVTGAMPSTLNVNTPMARAGQVPVGGITITSSPPASPGTAHRAYIALRQGSTPQPIRLHLAQLVPQEFVPISAPWNLVFLELVWDGVDWLLTAAAGCERVLHNGLDHPDYALIFPPSSTLTDRQAAAGLLTNRFSGVPGLLAALREMPVRYDFAASDLRAAISGRASDDARLATRSQLFLPRWNAVAAVMSTTSSPVMCRAVAAAANHRLFTSHTATVNGQTNTVSTLSAHPGFVALGRPASYPDQETWFTDCFVGCYAHTSLMQDASGGSASLDSAIRTAMGQLTGFTPIVNTGS